MTEAATRYITPFNSPVEIGLRAVATLNDVFPSEYSLQRLVIFDYLVIHSDDIAGGPIGIHPKTPHRSGELLVRRDTLQKGLLLFMSRGLIECKYRETGVRYVATEHTSAFLDVLEADYVADLRERVAWLVESFGEMTDAKLECLVHEHLGEWGAEFEMESVLWMEDPE